MSSQLGDYLDSFRDYLRIDAAVKCSVAAELRTHLEDRSRELRESGVSEEAASRAAIESFGPVELVARQICKVHGHGTWQEAFLAALPHLLVALLFATYYWENILCTSMTGVAVVSTVVYGWCRNQPMWLFPWLGYYLLPVITTGVLLIYLPQGWTWLAALVYLPFALFVIAYIMKQTASRDRLYVSLMLAPLPIICAWLLTMGLGSGFLTGSMHSAQLSLDIHGIVVSFLVLAVASFTFIRVTRRWCKVATLFAPLTVIFVAIALMGGQNINLWGWVLLVSCVFVVASPAWLELRPLTTR